MEKAKEHQEQRGNVNERTEEGTMEKGRQTHRPTDLTVWMAFQGAPASWPLICVTSTRPRVIKASTAAAGEGQQQQLVVNCFP